MWPSKQQTSPERRNEHGQGHRTAERARGARKGRPPPPPGWPQLNGQERRALMIPPPPAPTNGRPIAVRGASNHAFGQERGLRLSIPDEALFHQQERVDFPSAPWRPIRLRTALILIVAILAACVTVARPAEVRREVDRVVALSRNALDSLRDYWESLVGPPAEVEAFVSSAEADPVVPPLPTLPTPDPGALASAPTTPSEPPSEPALPELEVPSRLSAEEPTPVVEVLGEHSNEVIEAVEPSEGEDKAPKPGRARQRRVAKRAAPVAHAPVAQAPVAQTGFLRINAVPWAAVYVDGKFIGYTPQAALKLSAGRHVITLKNDEFDLKKDISVQIKPGVTDTRVVNLVRSQKG